MKALELIQLLKTSEQQIIIIDVRSSIEHQQEKLSIEYVKPNDTYINLPLNELNLLDTFITELIQIQKKVSSESFPKIIFHCQSGVRSLKALNHTSKLFTIEMMPENSLNEIGHLEGGIEEWKISQLPVLKNNKTIPLMRQVFIAASSMILIGLSWHFFSWFNCPEIGLFFILFVASGLMLSGTTGFCGMALLLAKMPWNN